MTAIDDLFNEVPPAPPSCLYLTLTDAVPLSGPHGRYIKLVCLDTEDLPIEATADSRYFHLLEPYIEVLRQFRRGLNDDALPMVPVFKGEDGKWRFSWLAAGRDFPERVKSESAPAPTYTPDPSMAGRAFRMQVSVPGALAEQFKQHAAQRGCTHTDLLLTLIREAVTGVG